MAAHPVRITVSDDLRRNRLLVFFRLPLVVPHVVWLYLWAFPLTVAALINWFVTLFRATPAGPLHRFTARYVRYQLHVSAFALLAANPFPGFTGRPDSYPIDLVLPEPARQNRWKTFFRLLLVYPASLLSGVLIWAGATGAFLSWFVALVKGTEPAGLRDLNAYVLRYAAQLNAYQYLLTDAYPQASPLLEAQMPAVTPSEPA